MMDVDVIIDDEPFDIDMQERRPRSRTWPILPPPSIETIHEDDDGLSTHASVTELNQIDEDRGGETAALAAEEEEKSPASTDQDPSPQRKNARKNAWGNFSYADLITQAIQSTEDQRLTLSAIYDWMVQNIPYFKDKGDSTSSAGWKNSIRHNLSLHSRFMRVQNDNNGKSSYWVINPDAKPGKSSRRRSGSVDGPPKEKVTKRSRSKKLAQSVDDITSLSPCNIQRLDVRTNLSCTDLTYTSTCASPCSSTDSLPGQESDFTSVTANGVTSATDSLYPFSQIGEQFTRPRSSSNVSTQSSVVGDRMTPVQSSVDLDDDYLQRIASLKSEETDIMDVITGKLGMSENGSPALNHSNSLTSEMMDAMHLNNLAIGISSVQQSPDTINLDDSMKMMSPNDGSQFNQGPSVQKPAFNNDLMVRRAHSDSFGSGDSGYESPAAAYFNSPTQSQQPSTQQMVPSPTNNMNNNLVPNGLVPNKPPPPYTNHLQPQASRQYLNQHAPFQQQPSPQTKPTPPPQNFFPKQMPPQLSPNPPQLSPQSYQMGANSAPMQRLQHMPLKKQQTTFQQSMPYQQASPGMFQHRAMANQMKSRQQQQSPVLANGMNNYNQSLPQMKAGQLSTNHMNQVAASMSAMSQQRLPATGSVQSNLHEQTDFPADLNGVELQNFQDLDARDLDAIIKKEMGESAHLDTMFEPYLHFNNNNNGMMLNINNNNNTIINNNTIVNMNGGSTAVRDHSTGYTLQQQQQQLQQQSAMMQAQRSHGWVVR